MEDAHRAAQPHHAAHPHHCWLAYTISIVAPHLLHAHRCRHVTHRILITTSGRADVTWTTGGVEAGYQAAPGLVAFFPHDDARHVFTLVSADGYRGHVICLPADHLPFFGLAARPEIADPALTAYLQRLATIRHGCPVAEGIGDEVVARRILVRLAELLGQSPTAAGHQSGFTAAVMRQLVGTIDARLNCPPSTRSLGALVALSPSHFARKFLQSTGLSLNRFVNLRRIRQSLLPVGETSLPLARIALDLGFSSQSHFTRLFSGLMGLAPNQLRRLGRAVDS